MNDAFKSQLNLLWGIGFVVLLSLLIPTKQIEEIDERPTEGEDHDGRNVFFNYIHTGNKTDDSWREELKTMRLERAETRIRKRRTRASVGNIETFGSITGKWTERGAKNMAGRVIATDVLESRNKFLMGTDGGSIMLGDLEGNDYEILNDPIKLTAQTVLLFENGTEERIVVVTDRAAYATDDYGLNWTKTKGFTTIESVTFSRETNTLFIITNQGKLYSSTDEGKSFTLLETVPIYEGNTSIWTARYADSPLYIQGGNQIYKYENSTLTTLGTLPVTNSYEAILSGSDDWSQNTLFTAVDNGSTIDLYRSLDEGVTWNKQGTCPENKFFRRKSFYSVNSNVLYIGDAECYRSNDAGVTWTRINAWSAYGIDPETNLHSDITEIRSYETSDGSSVTIISTDGGSYKSYDNSSYKNICLHNTRNSQYYGTQTRWDTPDIILAGAQDQGAQRSWSGQSEEIYDFERFTTGDEGSFASSDSGKSSWYSYINGSLYYNPDTRYSNARRAGTPQNDGGFMWMSQTHADPSDPQVVYIGGNYLHKVTYNNGGFDFEQQSTFNFNSSISAFDISPYDNNHWYVGTTNKKFYHSSDRGKNWTLMNSNGLTDEWLVGQEVIADPTQPGTVYYSGNGSPSVLVSHDHGATFSSFGTNPPSGIAVYNMVLSSDGRYLFAATALAPYVYIFEENTWYDISGMGAPDQMYYNVEFVPTTNTARFSTFGRGIWDFEIQQSATVKTLSITSYGNGSVTPNGIRTLDIGESQTISITPDQWYQVDSVVVDGMNKGQITSYDASYTGENQSIEIYFGWDYSALTPYSIINTTTNDTVVLPEGSDTTITINSDTSYKVDSVLIDGINRGPLVTASFMNITDDHTIEQFASLSAVKQDYDEWEFIMSYIDGDTVTHNGHLWAANFWVNTEPTSSNTGWTDLGEYTPVVTIDTTITAVMDYYENMSGSDDTLIITTTTVIDLKTTVEIDTIIISDGVVAMTPMTQNITQRLAIQGFFNKQLRLQVPTKGVYTIKLIALNGRILHNLNVDLEKGSHSVPLQSKAFGQQIAIVSIEGMDQHITQKIDIK